VEGSSRTSFGSCSVGNPDQLCCGVLERIQGPMVHKMCECPGKIYAENSNNTRALV